MTTTDAVLALAVAGVLGLEAVPLLTALLVYLLVIVAIVAVPAAFIHLIIQGSLDNGS